MASFEPLAADATGKGQTCLVVTAGIGMVDTIDRILEELETGQRIKVVATPLAEEWLDAGGLSEQIRDLTGSLPESKFRNPWSVKPEQMSNRCLASPVTLNTLTKWAAGQADNLALSMLCEATWTDGIQVVAQVTLNGSYGKHPAGKPALDVLVKAGVEVVPYVAGTAMKNVLADTYSRNQIPTNLQSH